MRQEATLTSRLKHPCIVALIGIAFSPKLVMALELAPLGSYRFELSKLSHWYIEQRNYLSGPLVYDQIYHVHLCKQSRPSSGISFKSALFVNTLKGYSMMR